MVNIFLRHIQSRIRHANRERCIRSHQRYWSAIQNSQAGSPAWVIGNGPSLKYEDLDKIRGQTCIASNRIHLIFEKTNWRPSFFTVTDPLIWKKYSSELLPLHQSIHLPSYLYSVLQAHPKLIYWRCNGLAISQNGPEFPFSNKLISGLYGGNTVTFENLQIAASLGCNPIYLIGCDHYYLDENPTEVDTPISAGMNNHFHPNYRSKDEKIMPAFIHNMNKAFMIAKKWGDANGVLILNATRGGHLDIFPRVDTDAALAGDIR